MDAVATGEPALPVVGNGTSGECATCDVLDDVVSWIAQICLPAIVGVFLVVLWYIETSRRTFGAFVMDNMKQGVAALFLHFVGVAISSAMQRLEKRANSCEWYFLFFIIDTAVGLAFTIGTHHVTARLFSRFERTAFLSRIGNYNGKDGSPGSTRERGLRWVGQLVHYILCSCLSRSMVFTVLYLCRVPLVSAVTWLFSWQCTEGQKDAVLVIVLIIVPLCADGLQVAKQNWWLRDRKSTKKDGSRPLLDHEYNRSDDDSDDDDDDRSALELTPFTTPPQPLRE